MTGRRRARITWGLAVAGSFGEHKDALCVRRRLERIGDPDRRASEFDPVGAAHGGQSLRTCRAGQQCGELFEETLKPRWRGDHQQPPRGLTDVLEGVWRAARPELLTRLLTTNLDERGQCWNAHVAAWRASEPFGRRRPGQRPSPGMRAANSSKKRSSPDGVVITSNRPGVSPRFWKACGVPRGPNAMPPVDTLSMAPPALNRKSPSRTYHSSSSRRCVCSAGPCFGPITSSEFQDCERAIGLPGRRLDSDRVTCRSPQRSALTRLNGEGRNGSGHVGSSPGRTARDKATCQPGIAHSVPPSPTNRACCAERYARWQFGGRAVPCLC